MKCCAGEPKAGRGEGGIRPGGGVARAVGSENYEDSVPRNKMTVLLVTLLYCVAWPFFFKANLLQTESHTS